MARIWWMLARGPSLVQLTWVAVLTLTIATTAGMDASAVGTAVAIVVVLAFAGRGTVAHGYAPAETVGGPPSEEKRLRGAFRRQSFPDTPGRPRRPRAPGRPRATA
ncbi:DUF6412 domain-containing protein [Nocardia sp. X0981]